MRGQYRPFIPQMTHCKQCRADACGILGEDKDMEFEVLMSRIGEEYSEAIRPWTRSLPLPIQTGSAIAAN